ncbi:class I SAM-dependent methyltransferase [candidate division WWE3 bacterium]|uniref:Class I SAM-dependent methyltransferase n=1 Tax=candidate division WWE3 bacterium TaxID=2053526 RepID=A0A955LL44_UNCKA|nr:class I SAM-dependent methyltransferase [candidate division WWE3 bacterium]
MAEISDYDRSGYDYTKYWIERQYEDEAEKRALSVMLPQTPGKLLDLGGSFGRLMSVYGLRVKQAVIADYSEKALEVAQKTINEQNINNVSTSKQDAYHMSFADGDFDTVILIRVLHHIENVDELFAEVNRVLKPGGIFVLEMANKMHLKNVFKHLLKFDLGFFNNREPLNLSSTMINNEAGIFYNFHPKTIEEQLKNNGFVVVKKRSVSNLRLPARIKNLLPLTVLMILDTLLTPFFTALNLGPSIWFTLQKRQD